uniref:Uncharacterized protein n=1 Tax=uncultured bacterium A1Q1_fos_2107 TaxID=1256562 RepID=L7VUS2_9BACT|nr:hypothetical protein [uncultured bacterium A1Q1_fos_2107]
MATEQAHEHAGGRPQLDIGRATTGAPVDAVVEALVARVDRGVLSRRDRRWRRWVRRGNRGCVLGGALTGRLLRRWQR